MAIRTTFSFDHLAPPAGGGTNVGNVTAKMLGDMPVEYRAIGGQKGLMVRPDGYITNAFTGLNTSGSLGLVASKVKVGTPKKSWFGCRVKALVSPSLPNLILALATPAYIQAAAAHAATAFTFGDAVTTNVGLVNRDFYVELGIDWVNHTIEKRIDGEFHSIISVPAAVATSMDAGTIAVLMIGTYGSNNQAGFRDVYWADNTDDGSVNGPLGVQFTALLDEEVVEPTVWLPNAGSLQAALPTKVDMTNNLDTPVLYANTGLEPLQVKFKLPVGTPAHSIQAVSGFVSAGLTTTDTAVLETSLKQNGVETAPKVSSVNGTLVHCKPTATLDKAPDGSNWTVDKLNSTVLTIKAT